MSAHAATLSPCTDCPRQILVVDDDETVCDVLREIAEREGVETAIAHTSVDALQRLEADAFGLLVVDIRLPDEHGLKLIARARNHPLHRHCPVLVISGRFDEADLTKVEEALPNCQVLHKPLETSAFRSALELALPAPKPAERGTIAAAGFALQVDHEEGVARLVARGAGPHIITDRETLRAQLENQEVRTGIDHQAIDDAFIRLAEGRLVDTAIVIARAHPPVSGEPGRIAYHVDVTGEATYRGPSTAEDASVDFHAATAVTLIETDDLLAEIVPPTEGQAGVRLTGAALPAEPGAPASLQAGDGCRTDEEGRRVYAAIPGRPVLASDELRVSPVYEVQEDVDFTTGNIEFDGHVIVRGSVKDGFAVHCESAEIHGTVDACTVHCKGDLVVRGGINGRKRAEIHVSGYVHAKYVNQARVTAFGDVTAEREILHAQVWSQGRIAASQIVGGQCLALLGIETDTLGSDIGIRTEVQAGVNFEVHKKDLELQELEHAIAPLLKPVQSLFGDREAFQRLPRATQNEHRQQLAQFADLKRHHDSLSADREMLVSMQAYQPVKEVRVRRLLNPDTIVKIGPYSHHYKHELKGPLRLLEDPAQGAVCLAADDGGPVPTPTEEDRTERQPRPSRGNAPSRLYTTEDLQGLYEQYAALVAETAFTYVVADPSVAGRKTVCRALREAGCEDIREAKCGTLALGLAHKAAHTVVAIIEVGLQDMDAAAFIRKIRSGEDLQQSRILLVTSEMRKDRLLPAIQSGVDAYLPKPVDIDRLAERLRSLNAL